MARRSPFFFAFLKVTAEFFHDIIVLLKIYEEVFVPANADSYQKSPPRRRFPADADLFDKLRYVLIRIDTFFHEITFFAIIDNNTQNFIFQSIPQQILHKMKNRGLIQPLLFILCL